MHNSVRERGRRGQRYACGFVAQEKRIGGMDVEHCAPCVHSCKMQTACCRSTRTVQFGTRCRKPWFVVEPTSSGARSQSVTLITAPTAQLGSFAKNSGTAGSCSVEL